MEGLGENFGFNQSRLSLVKFEVEVTTAGAVKFQSTLPATLQMRAGKAMIDPRLGEVDLPAGRHEIVVIVDRVERGNEPLSIELLDVDGSAAQARIVSGI